MKKTYYKGQQLSGCNASIVEMTSKEYALLTDAQKKAINAFVILTDVNDSSSGENKPVQISFTNTINATTYGELVFVENALKNNEKTHGIIFASTSNIEGIVEKEISPDSLNKEPGFIEFGEGSLTFIKFAGFSNDNSIDEVFGLGGLGAGDENLIFLVGISTLNAVDINGNNYSATGPCLACVEEDPDTSRLYLYTYKGITENIPTNLVKYSISVQIDFQEP